MDGENRYPIFLKCRRPLAEEEIKKIERYLRNRRKSGGGECGPLSRESDQVYRICFRYQEDQHAVLQRCNHVVEPGDADLAFRVQSDSSDQNQPSSSSTLPPSGEEHELHLDVKECPKAAEDLDIGLSSLACSAQLYPEDKRVLVRTLVQPQTVGRDDVISWKAEVNKPVGEYPQVNSRLNEIEDRVTLIDNRIEEVNRLPQEPGTGSSVSTDVGVQIDAASQDTATGCSGNDIYVQVVEGTIETQQVDAVVSPMVGGDPLSTRVGNALYETVGSQLIETYQKATRGGTAPGDSFLVEGLSGLPSNAVFFLNLACWDNDEEGTATQVLRLAISNVFTTCENRGFESVALPVVAAGMALQFPVDVVARVLVEQIHAFKQERAGRTPFLIHIVIHPSDKELIKAFGSVKELLPLERFHPANKESDTKRIVLLGKTGSGKSSLGDIIFGKKIFAIDHTPSSGTSQCQAETQSVNGRSITLIDTPGFFDSQRSEEDLKPEIMRCITECAPGPHAFVIVLKVEKFSQQEQAVITEICQYFTEEALKNTIIVFTHGNQLPKGWTIEKFISKNEHLSDLVKKCGNRCHVFDNVYWNNNQQNNYRSNQFQVEELLKTVDKMVKENHWGFYTNKTFEEVEKEIQKEEEEQVRLSPVGMTPDERRKKAKAIVLKVLKEVAGTTTGALLGVLFGLKDMVGFFTTAMPKIRPVLATLSSAAPALGLPAIGGQVAVGAVSVAAVTVAVVGGAEGGVIGYEAAKDAESVTDAIEKAYHAVKTKKQTG